ncbi:MAG: hypothetical protein ACKVPJ_05340 [Chitinophagales bacterium]
MQNIKVHIVATLLLLNSALFAQVPVFLEILNPINDGEIFPKNFKQQDVFLSVEEREYYLQEILFSLYDAGYLAAGFSIKTIQNDTVKVLFEKGRKFYWAQLSIANDNKIFLSETNFREKDFKNEVFRFDEVSALMQDMLSFAEEHGYPFATVQLDSVQIFDSTITAVILFERNRLIYFDSIRIEGDLQLSYSYLHQYTGIHKGELYNERLVKELDERLQELLFASVRRPSQVVFSGDRAMLLCYLEKKNASKFDFLIGVLPNNEITGRLIITGEGSLRLNNVFNAGELLDIHFSKLELSTKELQSKFTYPYLPLINLGIDASFDLFLKDSTFLERRTSAGLFYQFIGNNYVKAFSTFYNSDVLSIDTAGILIAKTLPLTLDVSSVSYGLAFNQEKLDYIYNPRKGFDIYVSAAAGTKTIKQNSLITSLFDPTNPEFDFATLYDSIDTKSLHLTYQYHASYFQPVLKNTSLVFKISGAAIIDKQVFANELYRIGGINLLRGFDEQIVFVSEYHVFTTELRYLLSQNSFAGIFFDQAYTQDDSKKPMTSDFPFGFGAGITFETKAGIFAVNYALGTQNDNPVQLRNAKIHFGYLNYF